MKHGLLGSFSSGRLTLDCYPQVCNQLQSGLVLQINGLGNSGRDWIEFTLEDINSITNLRDICQDVIDAVTAQQEIGNI